MTSKTITLSGTELKVNYSGGGNAWLRNDGTSVIYASGSAGISAGADGVISIPAGQAAVVYGANGAVYLLGAGSVQLVGSDYADCPFKTSAQSSGSGADEVARAAIEAYAADADIHVTAADKSRWNGLSNANRLINPDFAINQRGATSYPIGQYTVDCWKANNVSVEVVSGGVKLTVVNSSALTEFLQKLEFSYSDLAGRKIAVSAVIDGEYVHAEGTVPAEKPSKTSELVYTSGNWRFGLSWSSAGNYYVRFTDSGSAVEIGSANLEIGSAATTFIPPVYSEELLKCQRYLQKYSDGTIGTGYAISGTQAVVFLPLKTSLRGLSGVSAELSGTLSLGTVTHSGSNSIACTSVTYNKTSTCYCKLVCAASGLTAGEPVEAQIRTAGDMILISAEL